MTVKYEQAGDHSVQIERPRLPAMLKGFQLKCPACGTGKLMAGYLKVAERCAHCGEDLHHQRADDAPAYFTITIVAHVILPAVFVAEVSWHFPYWLHAAIWLPLTLGLTFWLMPRVKGALIGLQWALRMHGFGGEAVEDSQYLERPGNP